MMHYFIVVIVNGVSKVGRRCRYGDREKAFFHLLISIERLAEVS